MSFVAVITSISYTPLPAFNGLPLTFSTFANVNELPGFSVERMFGGVPISISLPAIENVNGFPGVTAVLITPIVLSFSTFENVNDYPGVDLSLGLRLNIPTILNEQTFPVLTATFQTPIVLTLTTYINPQTFPTLTVGAVVSVPERRAYRVRITETATVGSRPETATLELRSVIGGATVATGGTAISDSVYLTNVAANAFDTNATTAWRSNGLTGPFARLWIGYDFGATEAAWKSIVEIAMTMRSDVVAANIPKVMVVESSNDLVTWTELWWIDESQTSGWTAGQTKVFTLSGSTPSVRASQVSTEVIFGERIGFRATSVMAEVLRAYPVPDEAAVSAPADPAVPDPVAAPYYVDNWWASPSISNSDLAKDGAIPRTYGVYPYVNTAGTNKAVRAINPVWGKRTWEQRMGGTSMTAARVGVGLSGTSNAAKLGVTTNSIGYDANGTVYHNNVSVATLSTWTNGDTIACHFDSVTRKIWFSKNGTVTGNPTAGTGEAYQLPAGTYYPMASVINQPHLMATFFTPEARYVSVSLIHTPATPPVDFRMFDRFGSFSPRS